MPKDDGPERSDEPGKARDAEPSGNGGSSVADQAADDAPLAPEPPPIKGDGQLTLGGLGPRRMPVESEISLMSAAVPADGLIDPEKEGQLLVSYKPDKYEYVPVREGGKIVRWKLRQSLRPVFVMRPEQWEGFVEEQKEFAESEQKAQPVGAR